MGLIRKSLSLSTLGAVDWSSSKEKTANAARRSSRAQAKLLREQARLVRAERKALDSETSP